MNRMPRGFVVTLGLSALLIGVAAMVQLRGPSRQEAPSAAAMPESCVRYGKVECCYKGE